MMSKKHVAILLLAVLLAAGIRPVFAQVNADHFFRPDAPQGDEPLLDEPTITILELQEWVQGSDQLPGRYVTSQRVVLTQNASSPIRRPGLPEIWPNEHTDDVVYSGSYVMTMSRWLQNTPDWLGRPWVNAGGSTTTNVTTEEIRVRGTHYWGGSGCNNAGPNFSGTGYNTTSVSAQTTPALFGGNQWHCVKGGEHQAKINGWWPFWVTGQEGPTAYW